MLKLFKLVLVVLFLVIGAAFAIINDRPVDLDLYFLVTQLPLSLILILAAGLGIGLGAIVSSFYFMRLRKQNADLRRHARVAQQEVANLRKLPTKGH